MLFPSCLEAALELQQSCDASPTLDPSKLFKAFWHNRRYGGSGDRRTVYSLWRSALMWRAHALFLTSVSSDTLTRNRLALFLYLLTQHKLQDIQAWCQHPRGPSPLSSEEQAVLEASQTLESQYPEWVKAEIPQDLYPLFRESFGHEAVTIGQALNPLASLDLRVRTHRISRETLQKRFESQGIACTPTPFSPLGVRLKGRTGLPRLPHDPGQDFEIQDEGSQLIGLCINPQENEWILDFCAGIGGKTQIIAEHLPSSARLVATDTASWRLKRAQERLRTSGLTCPVDFYTLTPEWLKTYRGKFNKILVDAPCSGTGVWRRHPLQKWSLKPHDIQNFSQIQVDLLAQATCLARPGGLIFYATCSVLKHENSDVCQRFLALHPNVTPEPLLKSKLFLWPSSSNLSGASNEHSLTPLIHGTDGFFIACFRVLS